MIRRLASVVLVLVACKRDVPAPVADAGAVAVAVEGNPFVRTFPFKTATITYTQKSGNYGKRTRIKGQKVRSEATLGLFADKGDYSLVDGDGEYNVSAARKKIIVFRSDAAHLYEVYRGLGPAEQANVRRSMGIVGPDLPFYLEAIPVFTGERDFGGLHARCYHLTPRFGLAPSDHCYARGIELDANGQNPFDETARIDATAIVELDSPLDDALFVLPADYTREIAPTEESMHGVYRNLVERMEKPDFALAGLQREIGISK